MIMNFDIPNEKNLISCFTDQLPGRHQQDTTEHQIVENDS